MNEIIEKLQKRYNDIIIKEKAQIVAVYFNELPNISKCDFSEIQQKCKELGFYVYKANNCPVNTTFFKKQWNNEPCLILYSDFSLTQINHTKDYWRA